MSRRANTQYTAGGTDFDVVTGADSFLKKDLQALQAAVEGHDHTATKGLPAGRVGTASVGTAQMVALSVDATVLANNAVTTNKILDGAVTASKLGAGAATGAALGADVVTIGGAQNITGAKTLQSALLQNITTVDGAFREDRGNDIPSIAALVLGDDGNSFLITGTTNITSIGVKPAGVVVRLIFNGVLTVVDGVGTIHLNGDFITANESALTLLSMGTYWQEIGRTDQSGQFSRIVSGTYVGNNASSRTIATPFTPKLVLVYAGDNGGLGIGLSSVAFTGTILSDTANIIASDSSNPVITTNGFITGTASAGTNASMNSSGITYTYVAFG